MRWTQSVVRILRGRAVLLRTEKSCGPGAPTLALRLRTIVRKRRWQKSPVTGESTKDPVKTIAQGMPADAVYLWLLTRVLFVAHAASGATRIRHSLRPLCFVRVNRCTNSDALRRENIASRLSPLSCPASSGASSTPRPLGLSTAASGILDRPVIPDRVGDRRRATTRAPLAGRMARSYIIAQGAGLEAATPF